MAEYSFFHDGTIRGDGDIAPYNAETFHSVLKNLYSGLSNGVVHTGGITDLQVTGNGVNMIISIAAGSAFVEGIYFNNSAPVTFTLDTAYTGRWDRIVIRVDWNTQQARLVVLKGEESEHPLIPAPQQDPGNIYEFSLAKIYIPQASAAVFNTYVLDDRVYLPRPTDPHIINFMPNSEFIMGAQTGYDSVAPAYWWTTNTPTINNNIDYTSPSNYTDRGNKLDIDLGASGTLESELYCTGVSTLFYAQDYVTLSCYIFVEEGAVNIYTSSVGNPTNTIYPTGGFVKWVARIAVDSSNPSLELFFTPTGGAKFSIYQLTAAYGHNPAPFNVNREIILGGRPTLLRSDNRSTGTFTVAQYTVQRGIPYGNSTYIISILYKQTVYDTGSAGTNPVNAEIETNHVRTEVGNLTNSTRRHSIGFVPIVNDDPLSMPVTVVASGASTLNHSLYFIGAVV